MVFDAAYDDLLRDRVGAGGRWQWRIFLLTTIASNMAWQFFPVFTQLRGKHYCRLKFLERLDYSFDDMVRIGTPNALYVKDLEKTPSSCVQNNLNTLEERIQELQSATSLKYTKWYYDPEFVSYLVEYYYFSNDTYAVKWRNKTTLVLPCKDGMTYNETETPILSSVTMTFDLVCDREFWKMYSHIIYSLAMVAGLLLGSILSDRHGRKKIAMLFGSASFVFAVAVAVSTSVEMFIAFRAISAFLMAGTYISTDVLMCEVTDRRFRNIFIVLQSLYYNVIVAGFYTLGAYLCQDWRFLQLLVALPAATAAMFGWFIEESPRWLLSKGKNVEARMIIEKAILTNSGDDRLEKVIDTERIPDAYIDLRNYYQLVNKEKRLFCCRMPRCCKEFKYKLHHLFCHKTLLARLAVCMIAFLCVMLCRSDREIRISSFPGMNKYASYICEKLTVVPVAILGLLVYHLFDRRRPFIALAVITAMAFCIRGLIMTLADKGHESGKMHLSVLSYKAIAAINCLLSGCTITLCDMMVLRIVEIFPTEVRNSAYGLSISFGYAGHLLGFFLKKYMVKSVHKRYVSFYFAGSALLVAVMIFLTPASEDGANLLDTVEQLNHRMLQDEENSKKKKTAGEERKGKTRVRKQLAKNERRRKIPDEEADEADELAKIM